MKGVHNNFKKKLKQKWPDPFYIRIDHQTPSRKGIRIRYRVYPTQESDDYIIYIAIFSERGTLISNDPTTRPVWKVENNAYRSQPRQYRR